MERPRAYSSPLRPERASSSNHIRSVVSLQVQSLTCGLTKVQLTRKLLTLWVWPLIATAIDSMASSAFVQPNNQSYGVGAWYKASIGIVLHRNIDSLATLPTVGTSDSKTPAIVNEGKLLGFLASIESLAADLMVFFANAKLVQAYIYGKNNSC